MKSEHNDQTRHYENKLAYEIDSWDLSVALHSDALIVVVDARSPDALNSKHIPGSINIPHRTMSPETTASIDPSALVVTYCDGIGCNASTKGALNLARMGYNVRELIGGLDWWIRDGHPTNNSPTSGDAISCGCG
jgi:rhodanese-related sulfurtransferase